MWGVVDDELAGTIAGRPAECTSWRCPERRSTQCAAAARRRGRRCVLLARGELKMRDGEAGLGAWGSLPSLSKTHHSPLSASPCATAAVRRAHADCASRDADGSAAGQPTLELMAEVAEGPVPLLRRGLQHQAASGYYDQVMGKAPVHRAAVHRAALYKPGPHRGPARQDRARGVVFALRRGVVLDCMVGLAPHIHCGAATGAHERPARAVMRCALAPGCLGEPVGSTVLFVGGWRLVVGGWLSFRDG